MNRNRKPILPDGFEIPEVQPRVDPNLVTQTRRYKLITPLFGGGVTPGEADPITVVRASEVRGHLRFWWRATRGGQFDGDLEKMRKSEEAIWGSAAGKDRDGNERPGQSPVKIQVVTRTKGTPRPTDSKSIESYIRIADNNYDRVQEGVEFDLTLRYPAKLEEPHDTFNVGMMEEIEAALWAWEIFGGIGARTRRGAGALHCTAIDDVEVKSPQAHAVTSVIQQGLTRHVVEGKWPANIPHLLKDDLQYKVLTRRNWKPETAWHYLIKELRRFRQWRDGKKGFGRTLWPEPETIRSLIGSIAKKPAPRIVNVDKFPRGAFGLPIVFDMRHDYEQPKYTLQGQGYERLASPLILRPLACDGGKAAGLAVVLQSIDLPPKTELKEYGAVDASLNTSEANTIVPLGGQTNVLQAFLDYLE